MTLTLFYSKKGVNAILVLITEFTIIFIIICVQYQTKSSIREMDAYSQAGKQAEEVLKSVRTIVAFGGETKEVER